MTTPANNGIIVGCQDSFIRMYHHFNRRYEDNTDINPSGLLVGHTRAVSSLDTISFGSVNSDAPQRFVSGSWDSDMRLFDAKSMECIFLVEGVDKPTPTNPPSATLQDVSDLPATEQEQLPQADTVTLTGKGHSLEVLALSHCVIQPVGEANHSALIVSGGMDAHIKVWNLNIRKNENGAWVDDISLNTEFVHRETGPVQGGSAQTDEIGIWTLALDGSVAGTPQVYCGTLADGMVRGYDINSHKMIAKMKLHTDGVRHLRVANLNSGNSATLVSSSSDRSIKCVDLRANKVSMRSENISQHVSMHFDFDETNTMLFVADSGGSIRSFDTRMSLKKVDEVKFGHQGAITKIIYNKGLIYTGGGADKIVKVWDANRKLAAVATIPINDAVFAMSKIN